MTKKPISPKDLQETLIEEKKLIEEKGLDLKIYHSIFPKYEEKDYKENPLWMLLFPEIWIDEIDFEKKCTKCSKKFLAIDLNKNVALGKLKKPIVTVNAQFTIIKKELKVKIEAELSGGRFEKFDKQGEYFYLMARSNLGNLINTPDDFLEYGGTCPECNRPIFKMFFMPGKYLKSNWNGDDIVEDSFYHDTLFTENAFKLIKSVEKKVIKDGVVILE